MSRDDHPPGASVRSVRNLLGCQPTPLLGMPGPLVGVGEGSISLRRWLTAYRVLRKAGALMRQSGSVRALP